MIEIAGAILIVLGVILGAAIAATLVWLAIAEWIFWRRAIQERRARLYGDE